jgi:hypothetical protein
MVITSRSGTQNHSISHWVSEGNLRLSGIGQSLAEKVIIQLPRLELWFNSDLKYFTRSSFTVSAVRDLQNKTVSIKTWNI